MITLEHIQTYKTFRGDIDGWARTKKPKDTMTDEIWSEIEGILQDLAIVNRGLASDIFRKQTIERIKSVSESEEVADMLLDLSKE